LLAILLNKSAMDDQNPRQCSSPSLDGFHRIFLFGGNQAKRPSVQPYSQLSFSAASPPPSLDELD
jgi:hypothetical protein